MKETLKILMFSDWEKGKKKDFNAYPNGIRTEAISYKKFTLSFSRNTCWWDLVGNQNNRALSPNLSLV